MKFLSETKQKIAEAFMHYLCLRLNFRNSVWRDGLPLKANELCMQDCCPAKG
ncbi:MAG: hypothetical protein HN872_13995 [Gammaproteobacteria bacterium]|nr:hypothetical protein [Gammaproteobacteria bacterium]MBT6480508.1 hypothetical protein [Gammaproteobacteria bacterium]MBT7227703.1 hypothetical protein [Gammaproteobacteria bacterium]